MNASLVVLSVVTYIKKVHAFSLLHYNEPKAECYQLAFVMESLTVICFRVDESSMSSWYMCFEMVAKHVTHLLLITRIHLAHKNTDHQKAKDEGVSMNILFSPFSYDL